MRPMMDMDPTENSMVSQPLKTMPHNRIIKTDTEILQEQLELFWTQKSVISSIGVHLSFMTLLNTVVSKHLPGCICSGSLCFMENMVTEGTGEWRSAFYLFWSVFLKWQNFQGEPYMVIIKHLYNAICILGLMNHKCIRALLRKWRISVKRG